MAGEAGISRDEAMGARDMRDTGEVTVRVKGSRRVYTSMLGSLATMVCIADLKSVVREES
jgi:hypothetical protein